MNCFIILLPKQQWNGNEEKGRQNSTEGNGASSLHDRRGGPDAGGRREEALRRQGKSRDLGFDPWAINCLMGRIGRERHERTVSIKQLTKARGLG